MIKIRRQLNNRLIIAPQRYIRLDLTPAQLILLKDPQLGVVKYANEIIIKLVINGVLGRKIDQHSHSLFILPITIDKINQTNQSKSVAYLLLAAFGNKLNALLAGNGVIVVDVG